MDRRVLVIGGTSLAALAILWCSSLLLRNAREPGGVPSAPALAASPENAFPDPALTDVLARLERLEGQLDELKRALVEDSSRRALPAPPSLQPPPANEPSAPEALDALDGRGQATISALQAIALDPQSPTRDRVIAAGELFNIDLRSGTKGLRTPEIVDALIDLLELEPDAEVRRMICFNTLGATESAHEVVLMRVLQQDESEAVRAQAADALQEGLDDPHVRAALELASESDPSELVRATAAEMLARWDDRDR